MPKSNSTPATLKTLHVPRKLHQEIRILAGRRDEGIQDVTTKALEMGIKLLKSHQPEPQPSVN